MIAPPPQARLSTLPRVDGSASYAYGGYAVTASATGPIEAQRWDEDPDEAVVDVIVRPAAGVGGPSERNLEGVVRRTLQDLLLVQEFPRCAIQVVLQVQATPTDDYANTKLNQPMLNLALLPALLHAAVLALLSAGLPMRTVATAAAVAVDGSVDGSSDNTNTTVHPTPRQVAAATSVHVFAFAGQGELLLAESEGAFSMAAWDAARAAALDTCCRTDAAMDTETPDLRSLIREAVQA